ncbi:TIGR00725 family protein [Myceligenerans pegani]|uniref:TIGR00725 family protein n=1 Tax=Myceligenerans pegani TaxID=2776917 RepID=A0ABR9MY66_9MICO|nr:TIGR00725 family protein [Myceligenerans sp. TRM 65318]MBE1875874.1 TIGR00725 family protein [Myceligenerans sp. TRM 65318]MBE3018145.1 TIGR00725 family protein [Myceligenerans sp. TRM 65318]
MSIQVAVCGPRHCTDQERADAHEIGRLLAEAGAIVLNGGGTGVMEAASAGAASAGGLAIGVRPGASRRDANPHLTATLATNMGEARNAVLVWSADAVVVVGGSWGTLSEYALAARRGVPVISIGGWQVLDAHGNPVPDAPPTASSPAEAVRFAIDAASAAARRTPDP